MKHLNKINLFYLVYLFLICSVKLNSQSYFDYASQDKSVEEPLGFVRYNTFTLLYSACSNSSSHPVYYSRYNRIVALNNNGTVRFDKIVGGIETFSPVQYSPTLDKGLLALSNVYMCNSNQGYALNVISRVDSMGNSIFTIYPPYEIYSGIVQISNTEFIYSTDKSIKKFNGLTGMPIATICTVQGTISALNTTKAQNIIVASDSVVAIIDTLGNTLASKPSQGKYSKIKQYKKTFYCLRANASVIDKLDSALNVVNSITASSSQQVTDFTIYNDSISIAYYNNVTNLSSISVYPVYTLSNSVNFSNNIINHKIVALQKDSDYNILTAEHRTDLEMLCGFICNIKHSSAGFTRVKTLSNISYTRDIILKRIKTNSFVIIDSSNYNTISYRYQNSVVVQNNSADTIKYFRISHPMHIQPYGSSNCGFHGMGNVYDTTLILNLPPNDSIDIQLRLLGATAYVQYPPSFSISICYDLSVPNHHLENNILNSSVCHTITLADVLELNKTTNYSQALYPNPTGKFLNISSKDPIETYSVMDLSGRIIFLGNNTREIDVSVLSSGMYIISFKVNENNYTKKFVKL